MGQVISINTNKYNVKNYLISYVKQCNYSYDDSIHKNNIDLSNFYISLESENKIYSLIYGSLFYKLNEIGYSIKPIIPRYIPGNENSLEDIIKKIMEYGFLLSNYSDVLNDLIITRTCYYPTLNNIKSLLNQGNILIGGILIDSELINFLEKDNISDTNTIIGSDIILIMGYSDLGLLIKTNYSDVLIDYKFIDNIKEVWNIVLKPPIV
jgi:hypothetical protein